MWISFIKYNLILTHGYFLLVAYNHIPLSLSLSLSLSQLLLPLILDREKSHGDNWIQIHKFKFFGLSNVILVAALRIFFNDESRNFF